MTTDSEIKVKFNKHSYEKINPPRDLRDDERNALEFLLAQSFTGCEELRKQLPFTKVSAACKTCGSIYLEVDQIAALPSQVEFTCPVFANTEDTHGMFLQVLTLVRDGYLDELQIWRGDLESVMTYPDLTDSEIYIEEFSAESEPDDMPKWKQILWYVIPSLILIVAAPVLIMVLLSQCTDKFH